MVNEHLDWEEAKTNMEYILSSFLVMIYFNLAVMMNHHVYCTDTSIVAINVGIVQAET